MEIRLINILVKIAEENPLKRPAIQSGSLEKGMTTNLI
jgi:hypothetical protein